MQSVFLADKRPPEEKLVDLRNEVCAELESTAIALHASDKAGQVTIDIFYNTHTPGLRASNALTAIREQAPKAVVLFQEGVDIDDHFGINETLQATQELALDSLTMAEDGAPSIGGAEILGYFRQVAYGMGRSGVPTFPLDVRSGLRRTLEAIIDIPLDEHYRDKTLNRAALTQKEIPDLIEIEVKEAVVASLLMEIRDTTAATQIITYLLGLATDSFETFERLGIDYQEAKYALEIAALKGSLSTAALYGSAHTGLFHALRKVVPRTTRTYLNTALTTDINVKNLIPNNRHSYYKLGSAIGYSNGDRIRMLAAHTVLEDSLGLMLRDAGFINTMPASEDSWDTMRQFARRLSKDYGGSEAALEHLHANPELVVDQMVEKGILIRI